MIGLSTSVSEKEWNKQEATTNGWKQKHWLLPKVGRSLNTKLFPFPFFDFDPTILGWMSNNNLKIGDVHRGALLFWIRGGGQMDAFLGGGCIGGMCRTIDGMDHEMRGLIQFCIAAFIFKARGIIIHDWWWSKQPNVWTWAWRGYPYSFLPGEMGKSSATALIGVNGGKRMQYFRNPVFGSRQSRLSWDWFGREVLCSNLTPHIFWHMCRDLYFPANNLPLRNCQRCCV